MCCMHCMGQLSLEKTKVTQSTDGVMLTAVIKNSPDTQYLLSVRVLQKGY